MSIALALYRAATGLLEPLAPTVLRRRARRGKEDGERLHERLGHASAERPAGPLVWLHGVSVGETLSLLPLVERLRASHPEATLLMTSGTLTSAELLARRLPAGVIHQFAPVDAPGAARRFFAHWRPELAVFVESELWPNLILGAKAQGARLALVSARITERTARGWSRLPGAARAILNAFDLVLAQDAETAARLERLGRPPDGRLNLKYAGAPLPFDETRLAALQQEAGARPVLLAASTHAGEEALVLETFQAVDAERAGNPLLVIVPRHPDRGAEVADLARGAGFNTGRSGEGDAFSSQCDVYVADRLGELGLWFRLARGAFIGGSLAPDIGGHNPLEAVQVGAPAISGPHVDNWASVFQDLRDAGLVRMLDSSADLPSAWEILLTTPDQRPRIAAEAAALQASRRAELDAAVARLGSLL